MDRRLGVPVAGDLAGGATGAEASGRRAMAEHQRRVDQLAVEPVFRCRTVGELSCRDGHGLRKRLAGRPGQPGRGNDGHRTGRQRQERERLVWLRRHPDLGSAEPEILELAAQMSHESRTLAQTFSTERVERCRERILRFFGASPDEYAVVFTANASQ